MKKIHVLIVALTVSIGSFAQHHEDENHHSKDHHSFHKHHIAVFNGGATNFDHHISGYTMGIDYEYRFIEHLGIGLIGEYLFLKEGEGESIFALPIYYHPIKGLKLSFAPIGVNATAHEAAELKSASATTPELQHHAPTKEWHFGSRASIGYDIPLGKVTLGPIVGLDMINHTQSLIYELSLGFGF